MATVPTASDDEIGTCEFVKTFTLYGIKNTVGFVGADAEPSEKELIACAKRTIVDGSHIVYLFNNLARAHSSGSDWGLVASSDFKCFPPLLDPNPREATIGHNCLQRKTLSSAAPETGSERK